MKPAQKPVFYTTPPHPCSYLPGQEAITLFADPQYPKNKRLYSALADYGFRRSGKHLYMPHCRHCSACIPVRIAVNEFSPSRTQKRTLKKNQDINLSVLPAVYNQEHFDLYKKYLCSRHPDGGMDNPVQETYMEFLTASWAETAFYEIRVSEQLVAVAVVDIMDDALSAVYTFFDPEYADRSPGRLAVLLEIEQARSLGLRWLYLGYWIENCAKMRYKSEYRPQQRFYNNNWHTYRDDQ